MEDTAALGESRLGELWFRRVAAFLVDASAFGAALELVVGSDFESPTRAAAWVVGFFLLRGALQLAFGRTPGKFLLGLRFQQHTQRARIVLRDLLYSAFALLLFLPDLLAGADSASTAKLLAIPLICADGGWLLASGRSLVDRISGTGFDLLMKT